MRKWTTAGRVLALALCAACAFALTPASAESAAAPAARVFTMAGFDGDDTSHDWSTNKFFQKMEERTGVSFTFNQFTNYVKWQAEKTAMFTDGELPDVLFKAELSSAEQIAYARAGKLVDLKPLLPECAPNLWALLTAHPDWLQAITLPTGEIVALPTINEMPVQNAIWINTQWLKQLKLDPPTDAASFRAVLEAFKTQDPNRNGKSDEIPMTFLGAFDLKFLLHAFGVVANDYNVYVDAAGKVRYAPLDEAYGEGLRWLRGLYRDGLLHKDGFTTADALRTISEEKNPVIYGVVMGSSPLSLMPMAHAEQFSMLDPLAYNGAQVYRDFIGPLKRGTFAITTACESPELLLRWVDLLYTEEGGRLAMAGTEGEEYETAEDGLWKWVGEDQTTLNAIMTDAIVSDTGSMPWREPVEFQLRYAEEGARRMISELNAFERFARRPFPVVTLDAAQEARAVEMQNTLGAYVDTQFSRFVLGEIELSDETLAAFRAGLQERGVDAFVAFWQEIVDGL